MITSEKLNAALRLLEPAPAPKDRAIRVEISEPETKDYYVVCRVIEPAKPAPEFITVSVIVLE